jgi:hypothetical protein
MFKNIVTQSLWITSERKKKNIHICWNNEWTIHISLLESFFRDMIANSLIKTFFECTPRHYVWCLDDYATPHLDTVTLRPAPSDTVTIRPTNVFILRQSDPTGVGQSDHTQTTQFDPLEGGSKRWLWQSDPWSIRPILCFARRVRGQFGRGHTDGAVNKWSCTTRENFTHAWVSRAQAWPNLTPNMARPTQQNST